MVAGPRDTPYEGGLFLFDIQLAKSHPLHPPLVHYHSYCGARLNPNLYEEGKVCISLLGTWSGRGTETWTSKSSIRQLLLSIQGNSFVSFIFHKINNALTNRISVSEEMYISFACFHP